MDDEVKESNELPMQNLNDSIEPSVSKSDVQMRKNRSQERFDVWEHFTKCKNKEGRINVICKYCSMS
jgi:hypothetical protein